MLAWFKKHAPIRTKFDVLFGLYTGSIAGAVLCAYLAGSGATSGTAMATVWLIAALGLIAFTALVGYGSKRLVCDPYVTTVLRMEALAEGDTQSHIMFRDHTNDCVGRMARAMETFRENAEQVQNSTVTQELTVKVLSEALNQLAKNDLTITLDKNLPTEYQQLRHDFDDAIQALRNAFISVGEARQTIDVGTGEINRATEDLAQRTQDQAARVEETLFEMNTLTGEVKKTASDAARVDSTMSDARNHAEMSGDVMKRAVEAMARIERASGEISGIIDVIDGIAFQTNLLALNAGVEAARAGESGKGFAVVASEVRALAQRAAEAANDVKQKVTGSQREVETGVKLVGETGVALDTIVSKISDVTTLVAEISESTQRQAGSLSTVNETVGEIDKMTQQNAAMVEEANAATRHLSEKTADLSQRLAMFNIGSGDAPLAMDTDMVWAA